MLKSLYYFWQMRGKRTQHQTIIIIVRIFIVMLPYFRFSWNFIYCELKSAFVRCTREWKIMEQKEVKFELSLRFVTINNADVSAKHAAKREHSIEFSSMLKVKCKWTWQWWYWKLERIDGLGSRIGSGFCVIEFLDLGDMKNNIFSTMKI